MQNDMVEEAGERINEALAIFGDVKVEDIPDIVNNQVEDIKKLEKKYDLAVSNANKAKDKAKDAEKKAEIAKNKSAGLFQKKAAIEAVQDATYGLATAQNELASVQGDTLDALNLSFEYEKKLGIITKGLFALGVSNIAANRAVVEQLQKKKKEGTQGALSDAAVQEIDILIDQLKSQQDFMFRQERIDKRIIQQEEKNKDQDARLDEGDKRDDEQDMRLNRGDERDDQQDAKLIEQQKKDIEHDKEIRKNRLLAVTAIISSGVAVLLSAISMLL